MKLILLGKSGMLGSAFLKKLAGEEGLEVFAFDKDILDITDKAALKEIFDRISPDFVINCAAYTAVDDCESNKELAYAINADAPLEIARLCNACGAKLIHFSTDYVFDGEKPEGYREDDSPAPINVYGASKLKGEQNIAEAHDKFFIVRTSWLFGENGKNFVDTMLRLADEKDELNIIGDQVGCPTYTFDLSQAVIDNFL